MLRILDKYVGFLFIRSAALSLFIFTILFILIDFFTRIWRFDPSLSATTIYYLLKFPEVIYQMMPVSTIMAALITLGSLSRYQELTAIHSAGISLLRASFPIIVLSCLMGIITFIVGDYIIPTSSQYTQKIYLSKIQEIQTTFSHKSVDLWYRAPNVIYNIKSMIPEKKQVEGITIYYLDEGFKPQKIISAFSGKYSNDSWILNNGKIIIFDQESTVPLTENFKHLAVEIEEKPEELASLEKQTETMSLKALRHFIKRNKKAGFSTQRHEVTIQSKFSFAFACIVLAFLAIPFGVQRGKHGGFARDVGLCLMVTFFYWLCLTVSISFGYNGTLSPFISAWVPNIIFLMVGFHVIKRNKMK